MNPKIKKKKKDEKIEEALNVQAAQMGGAIRKPILKKKKKEKKSRKHSTFKLAKWAVNNQCSTAPRINIYTRSFPVEAVLLIHRSSDKKCTNLCRGTTLQCFKHTARAVLTT